HLRLGKKLLVLTDEDGFHCRRADVDAEIHALTGRGSARPGRCSAYRPENSGCSTLSPGFAPMRAAVPAFSSSTERTGSPEGTMRVDSGSVRCAMRAMVPSARMNSMSSEM